jgi:hypothetical protein
MKKISWTKNVQNVQTIYFFALVVAKTTSRCFFGESNLSKNDIFIWGITFSRTIMEALKKHFIFKI